MRLTTFVIQSRPRWLYHIDLACSICRDIVSLSLSLLATGIDSVFDIGSNVLLLWLHNKAGKLDSNKWPVGGTRLETIGNIVYGKELPFLVDLLWLTST